MSGRACLYFHTMEILCGNHTAAIKLQFSTLQSATAGRNIYIVDKRNVTKTSAAGTQVILRVTSLLREVSTHGREGLRLTDIAERLALEPPTAHRILKILVSEQILRRGERTKRYFLGPMLFELGLAAAPQYNLRNACNTAMESIAQKTRDTVFLTQRAGLDSVCLERKEGSFPIKTFTLDVGIRRPLGIGSGSLAILAALPQSEIESIVEANAARLPKFDCGTNSKFLLAQVRRTQRRGYAVRDVPELSGVRTLGCVIRDRNCSPIAAFSISAISSRMSEARQAELVLVLSQEISRVERKLFTDQ